MLPQAVMRITGTSGSRIFICRSSSIPSLPVVAREKFISMIMSDTPVRVRAADSAPAGPSTAITSWPARLSNTLNESLTALSSSIINIISIANIRIYSGKIVIETDAASLL